MQLHLSLYKVTFIIDAGRALFAKYNATREEAKVMKTTFRSKIKDWNTPEDLRALTEYFDKRDSRKV
eukprot:3800822-Rhodomonas_salina.1